MAASALQTERHLLRHRPLLRMLPPRVPLPHRRRSWARAVRASHGDGGGAGGSASAVEKRSVPGMVGEEEHGARGEEELEGEMAGALELKWPPWEGLADRYKLIGATSLAFVICNMDKVNLSVAIIPMSHQYGWNSSTAGLVQSSFFWGYALSQLPGGWLAKLFGGREVLEVGVVTWSLATTIVPVVAGFMPGLVLSRILVGIGEGVSPSAATDLIARSIPLQERSRAVAVVFGGLSFGSVLGLLFAPPIIQNIGWESVFYIFGLLGVIWCLGFESLKVQLFGDREGLLSTATAQQTLERFPFVYIIENTSLSSTRWRAGWSSTADLVYLFLIFFQTKKSWSAVTMQPKFLVTRYETSMCSFSD